MNKLFWEFGKAHWEKVCLKVSRPAVHFGEQIVLGKDIHLDNTLVLDGLVDVHSFVESPIGRVILEVS